MAVPKKKKTIGKTNSRYIKNHKIVFKQRKFNYSPNDLFSFLLLKDNWLPLNFLKNK